jgi:aryl-alcohol dehydrogenase-like predicted oxidoreductase
MSMQVRKLGRSGLLVSPMTLGTMMFGGATDEATSRTIIDSAREAGVNFIDTADAYNDGRSEQIVGHAIRADRDRWVLATKAANMMGDGPNEKGLSRKWLIQACEASLRRLGTDYIDILYLHKEDHATPLDETVRAIGDLVRAGKIRYFGVSNHRAWRVAEICNLCDRLGLDRPVVSQPYYNAVNRMPEVEHLPACGHYGLGVVPYSPLARGILTAKYTPGAPAPEGTRVARGDKRVLQTEWRPQSLRLAQKFAARAARRGMTPGQFAFLWVLANPFVTSVIAGPRTMAQWTDYLGAFAHRWNPADEAFIDALVAPGHPSTPGYNDPAYPLEGRPQPA